MILNEPKWVEISLRKRVREVLLKKYDNHSKREGKSEMDIRNHRGIEANILVP